MFFLPVTFKVAAYNVNSAPQIQGGLSPLTLHSDSPHPIIFNRFSRDILPEITIYLAPYAQFVDIESQVKSFDGALLKLKITVIPSNSDASITNTIFCHLHDWCLHHDATVLMATESSSGATLLTITPGNSHKGVILQRMIDLASQELSMDVATLREHTACFGDDFGPGRNDTHLFAIGLADHRVLIVNKNDRDEGYDISPISSNQHRSSQDVFYAISDVSTSVGHYLAKTPSILLVVSDFDGTIKPIGKGKKPDEETLIQLAKVLSEGGFVAIATGASYEFLDSIQEWLQRLSQQQLLSRFSVHMYSGNVVLGAPQIEAYLSHNAFLRSSPLPPL